MSFKVKVNENLDTETRNHFINMVSKEQISRLVDNYHWSPKEATNITIFNLRKLEQSESDGSLKILTAFPEEKPNNIAGVLLLKVEKKPSGLCYVKYVYIEKEYRGHGIGSLLLNKSEEIAKKNNIKKIELNVFEDNYEAISCYEKKGYHTRHLIMTKDL